MAPLLDPLTAFIVSFVAMLIVAFRGWKVYASVALMVGLYAVLAATPQVIADSALKLLGWNDLRVLIFIFLSMLLAGVMEQTGLLKAMVDSLSAASCRVSLSAIPALVGLMPMPGGALVSAMAMRDKYFKEVGLSREDASFINYWFRHIVVPAWPLFQSVVITASVIHTSPTAIVAHTWPGALAAVLGGLLVSGGLMLRAKCRVEGSPRGFLKASSPLIALVALVMAGVDIMVATALVIVATVIAFRPSRSGLLKALAFALRPTIYVILVESLLFKELLLDTNISSSMLGIASQYGVPVVAVAFLTPFILGMAAGGEQFFAAAAMPMLYDYLVTPNGVNWWVLYVAYLGGFLGVMMSPVHLCLALTVDYYESKLTSVMARVAVAVSATAAIGMLLGPTAGHLSLHW